MASSKLITLAAVMAIILLLTDDTCASLAIGRQNGLMRPGRSLAVGRTFRPGRSLASGRPFFRPGKRGDEDEENTKQELQCNLELIDEYTGQLIEVVKKMVEFERRCGYDDTENAAANQSSPKST